MAAGDIYTFEELTIELGKKTHDLVNDTFKVALLTNATNPTTADVSPALASYTECSAGGNYATGGATLTVTYTEAGGTATFAITNPTTWALDGSNPTDAYWALIYNTSASNAALAYIDLGGPVDMTAQDLVLSWGQKTITVARVS